LEVYAAKIVPGLNLSLIHLEWIFNHAYA
jgi:hypothetical protein